jgi:macrolide transport system ATP-binding/permease protein
MRLWRKLAYLLPWKRRSEERDMQEELDALREMADPAELGNLTLAAENAREAWSWMWLERLFQDLRYAMRSMLHNKAFSALAILSLALGIGANTAIYSFMESIVMRSLPVADPESLIVMKWRAAKFTSASSSGMSWSTDGSYLDPEEGYVGTQFPFPALKLFQENTGILSSAFCYFAGSLTITAAGNTEVLKSHYVSGDYFRGIGIVPAAGRLILPDDDTPGAEAVAVLSYRYSRRYFGEAERAVGQTIRINDQPFTVAGVAPPEFFGAEPGTVPDVYVPIHAKLPLESRLVFPSASDPYLDANYYWVEMMGRLKPGVTLAQAQAALARQFRGFAEDTTSTERQREHLPELKLASGAAGLDSLRRRYSNPVYVLMAMVSLILLIACANIASLLLARATARRREIAVRLSIGAGRMRIIRQFLTESVLLASLGGALGVMLALWGIRVLTLLVASGRENFT